MDTKKSTKKSPACSQVLRLKALLMASVRFSSWRQQFESSWGLAAEAAFGRQEWS